MCVFLYCSDAAKSSFLAIHSFLNYVCLHCRKWQYYQKKVEIPPHQRAQSDDCYGQIWLGCVQICVCFYCFNAAKLKTYAGTVENCNIPREHQDSLCSTRFCLLYPGLGNNSLLHIRIRLVGIHHLLCSTRVYVATGKTNVDTLVRSQSLTMAHGRYRREIYPHNRLNLNRLKVIE